MVPYQVYLCTAIISETKRYFKLIDISFLTCQAMAEKIERMELDFDSRDKVYNIVSS